MNVRTRFAPSPTGYLHVGGIRTALFAWLVARQNGGAFILRLEDTDKSREVAHADEHIIASLKALGLDYDEGPDNGGAYGPYRQSERLKIYHSWAEKLIANGRAYADPYSQDELQQFRTDAQKQKQPFLYRNHRPEQPPTWDGSQPLRFRSDPKAYQWHDEVMGDMKTGPEVIDDFIILKSDGYPTYNFAHIVDDAEMRISHIIRGQEFLASMPNYLNLYEALDLTCPVFATMPHIMGPDGKRKLSKRDNAKDILDYLRDGILPEALVSFIATLGWNDGTTQEIFTRDELLKRFSLQHVGRAGAQFDERRLSWVSGHFIRQLASDDLVRLASDYMPAESQQFDDQYNQAVLQLCQERLKYFAELPELTRFFYIEPAPDSSLIYEHKKLKHYDKPTLVELLQHATTTLNEVEFNQEAITSCLNNLLEQHNEKPVTLFSLIRIALTQAPASPGLPETIVVLGKDTVLKRLQGQISYLQASLDQEKPHG